VQEMVLANCTYRCHHWHARQSGEKECLPHVCFTPTQLSAALQVYGDAGWYVHLPLGFAVPCIDVEAPQVRARARISYGTWTQGGADT